MAEEQRTQTETTQEPADIYKEFEAGIEYKNTIDLFTTVDTNERFYAGDHWNGIESSGVPKPVFNFLRRVTDYLVSAIKSRNVKMVLTPMKFNQPYETDANGLTAEQKNEMLADNLNDYAAATWERLKIDSINQKVLLDGALSGNGILYFYWDETMKSYAPDGQVIDGDINAELIDSVNFFPGNPNDPDIQRQPYIIISFRRLVDDIKKEAEANGISAEDIAEDDNKDKQAGDSAKNELDGTKKATCLLKLWRNADTGTIWAVKSTRDAIIKEAWDTGAELYPIANFCWRERKNSFFGVSELKEVIPNQVAYNKMCALQQIATMNFVSPKVIFDNSRVKSWSNKIGGAIPVNGNIDNVARYMDPPSLSADTYKIQADIKDNTQDCMGANDVSLGDVKPDNTSAFVMMREASMAPLENIQTRFYQFIEDMGRIWLNMWTTYYQSPRLTMFDKNGQETTVEFDPEYYKDLPIRLKIEVGAASQFSEITQIQTLDNLLANGIITPQEYLERLPNGYIPMRDEILNRMEQQAQPVYEAQPEQTEQPDGEISPNEMDIMGANQTLEEANTSVSMPEDIQERVENMYGI